MTITGSDQLVDPGVGSPTIRFLAKFSADTLVPRTGGVDQLSRLNPGTDLPAVRAMFEHAALDPRGDFAALRDYLTFPNQAADALIGFHPFGLGGGNTVAVSWAPGHSVFNMNTPLSQGDIRIV
jgi:hypothetical protein